MIRKYTKIARMDRLGSYSAHFSSVPSGVSIHTVASTRRTYPNHRGLKWITEPVNGHVHIYDLGYRILRRHWGRGIATECALACRDYAFREMGLSEIYAAAHVDNAASNRILTRIGMRLVGTFRFEGEGCNWYAMKKIT